MDNIKVLFLGDVYGKAGRKIISDHLPIIKKKYQLNLIIANAENTTNGKGLSWNHYQILKQAGIDYITMGNHTWFQKQDLELVLNQVDVIRPLNLVQDFNYFQLGKGSYLFSLNGLKIRITNLLGTSINLPFAITNPFVELKKLVLTKDCDLHIVDFHAETTSEKNAFCMVFDGYVTAILGTHTHVPSNDLRITPKGSVYITDVGMCGPGFGSVIGANPKQSIKLFCTGERQFFEVSNCGAQLNGVFFEVCSKTNQVVKIEQIRIVLDDEKYLANDYFNLVE
ncbi:TIGR00282 family metallophosphoesterase [Mycoplasmoides genitalium]|uniref:TIGR00282 family metallophosphoesterase n=1 Tax=Mycoplasmoides genitalium TaxID=2097 RepID=UPI002FCE23BA